MSVHSPQEAHTQPGAAKNVAAILDATADLLARPDGWTQGTIARLPNGWTTGDHNNSDATCFCIVGGLRRAADQCEVRGLLDRVDVLTACRKALAATIGLHGYKSTLVDWNDAPERTQAEVVAALRAAAEKARTAAPDSLAGDDAESGVNP